MIRLLIALAAMGVMGSAAAQTRQDVDMQIGRFQHFLNSNQPDSIYNMLSERGKTLMPQYKARKAFEGLYAQLGNFKSYEYISQQGAMATCKSVFDNGMLTLLVSLNKDNKFETLRFLPYNDSVSAKKSTVTETPKRPSNFVVQVPAGKLYGTLETPEAGKKMPVVLIIAGSGPTDRDCNSKLGASTNAFLMLADSLKQAGIASLRYDKRGVGESAGMITNESDMRFDDVITDAMACIKALKADGRFSKVIVVGHSEGALAGMVAARREKADAYVSLEGPGRSLADIIIEQVSAASKEDAAKSKVILDSMKKGYTVKDVPQELMNLFRPTVQPYMRSCLQYSPATEIAKLNMPILIVQGTTDIQVNVKDANALKKAAGKARLHIVTGMNHVLKQAPAEREGNLATYNDPALPLSKDLAPELIAFVKSIK